jgi:hypothetical protein
MFEADARSVLARYRQENYCTSNKPDSPKFAEHENTVYTELKLSERLYSKLHVIQSEVDTINQKYLDARQREEAISAERDHYHKANLRLE